ncbi:MAG: alkaline phosphatase [Deltaproteobacteria bacterium]|nr:alkaline phosphatase [Deltaproteobacteria bacterium]
MPRVLDVNRRAAPHRSLFSLILVLTLLASSCAGRRSGSDEATQRLRDALIDGPARSVVLLIGDGMGDSEITLARNYSAGAAGRLEMDALPLTGSYTTYAVQEAEPYLPDYVVDSAASATAWATGHKTSNGRLSTAAGSDEPLQTIAELVQQKGLLVGSVTTADLTDATPAALVSHVNSRRCQGPRDMGQCPNRRKAAGGPGSIAEQAIDHAVDVLLGGGKARFDQPIDAGPDAGRTVIESAVRQGYTVVTDAGGLAASTPGAKLLGLFAAGDMSAEWSGARAVTYPGSGPQRCKEGQRPAAEPSLATMARKALDLLDERAASRGFFLQIEGASIDKQDHAANPCGQIGETVAFDAAVRVVLDYAAAHPDTLVIVTADHAHSSQIVPEPLLYGYGGLSPGLLSTLITADGSTMTVSYATAAPFGVQTHTGTQVRVAAQGPGAADIVGVIDQTALFHTMARALGLPTSVRSTKP